MNDNTLKSGSSLQDGKYVIRDVLGQGGFGITYEAEQVSLGRKVAVKEFFMREYCEREDGSSHVTLGTSGSKELVSKFKDKFIREAKMIAGLDHEHVVKIHDVFEENGTAYYVMEYLGGGSLGDGVKSGKALPEQDALNYIRQIASALSYLHKKGIIHFDVKPSNVLKTEDGKLKLIDFGISKHYDEAGVQTSSTPIGISKGFAPLEQYKQGSDLKSFTPATDVYSLGATLYALLSGANPPEASDVSEDGLPAIVGVNSAIMQAIGKAMQPRRKDRPQSVAEFLKLLDSPVETGETDDKDKTDDNEETVVPESGVKVKDNGEDRDQAQDEETKFHKEDGTAVSGEQAEKQNPGESNGSKSKRFPKWLLGVLAGIVVVGVLAFVLFNRLGKSAIQADTPADGTAVVTETVPVPEDVSETPVKSQSSGPASEPESPAQPEVPTVIELTSISLSRTTLELEEGSSATLTVKYIPNNATDRSTTWESTDASVAKVSASGKVTAVSAGSSAIIASCQGKNAYCNVTVKAKEVQPSKTEQPAQQTSTSSSSSAALSQIAQTAHSTTGTHVGHEWVDLGLSVKWATCNVGAGSPEDYGSYFAWGETSPKSSYTWANLKYCTEGDSYENVKFSKYVAESKYGPLDGKTTLELSDDAARQNWGGSWRMPTIAEFQELIDNCTWTWTTLNGKNGYKVTSKKNGNSIFLSAAGWRHDTSLNFAGSYGDYWSSSLNESGSYARLLSFSSGYHYTYYNNRRYGQSVRPVFR